MRAHSDNALRVATFLAAHPRVEAVHYPGLPSHPQHDVARRQMTGFGGMLSVQVRGGRDAAYAVERAVRIFTCATSFGGTESLLEHRASVEGAATRSPDNLLAAVHRPGASRRSDRRSGPGAGRLNKARLIRWRPRRTRGNRFSVRVR